MTRPFHLIPGLARAWSRFVEPLPHLGLRLLLAYEFFEAGREKWQGTNWFMEIRDRFPFPLDHIPHEISWHLATGTELLGALLLLVGLGTRLASLALVILTLVAWASVHAGLGYNVCGNGWKLPLLYLAMFAPLLFNGPGRLSLDHLIERRLERA